MFLVIVLLLGLIPAAIAKGKGHSFIGWWIFGSLLFIVALPIAICLKPRINMLLMLICGACNKPISKQASTCPHCGQPQLMTIAPNFELHRQQWKAQHRSEPRPWLDALLPPKKRDPNDDWREVARGD
jgi:hypothetical protein